MKLTYIGPKQRHTFNFPIPYVSKGACEGEVLFEKNKETEVQDSWAKQLLALCPHFFAVPNQPQPKKG